MIKAKDIENRMEHHAFDTILLSLNLLQKEVAYLNTCYRMKGNSQRSILVSKQDTIEKLIGDFTELKKSLPPMAPVPDNTSTKSYVGYMFQSAK